MRRSRADHFSTERAVDAADSFAAVGGADERALDSRVSLLEFARSPDQKRLEAAKKYIYERLEDREVAAMLARWMHAGGAQ